MLALFTAYARVEKADDSVDNKEEANGLEPAWRVLTQVFQFLRRIESLVMQNPIDKYQTPGNQLLQLSFSLAHPCTPRLEALIA